MIKKLTSRLVVVAAGLTLALSAGVMGASTANAAQGGAIANPACGTNTTIFIRTTTTGATTHYYASTSGLELSWSKGTFSTPTESKTGTGYSTAKTVSAAGTTLTSISYSCG